MEPPRASPPPPSPPPPSSLSSAIFFPIWYRSSNASGSANQAHQQRYANTRRRQQGHQESLQREAPSCRCTRRGASVQDAICAGEDRVYRKVRRGGRRGVFGVRHRQKGFVAAAVSVVGVVAVLGVARLPTVRSVSAGTSHTCALTNESTIKVRRCTGGGLPKKCAIW